MLNKKVGDYDSGWSHRHAYVRIYDPRNFEFEITVENLLYILENTSAIKGKGLEGDFVYGWDGKDLVLIPTESPDYKEIIEYNNLIHNNETIKGKDLIVGATYLTKDNQERIYVGKFDYYSSGYNWFFNGEYHTSKKWSDVPRSNVSYSRVDYENIQLNYGKHFWFAYKYYDYHYENGNRVNDSTYKWEFEKTRSVSSGRFINCIDDKCTQFYPEIFELIECDCGYSPYDKSKDVLCSFVLEDFKKLGMEYYNEDDPKYSSLKFISTVSGRNESYLAEPIQRNEDCYKLKQYVKQEKNKYTYGYSVGFENTSVIKNNASLEEIFEGMMPLYKQCYLENGKEYRKEYTL